MNAVLASARTPFTPAQQAAFEQTRQIKAAWRVAAHAKQGTAAQHAAYALLRGRSLDETFAPLVNPNKIANAGGDPLRARHEAENAARRLSVHALAPWADALKDVPVSFGCYKPTAPHPLLDRLTAAA